MKQNEPNFEAIKAEILRRAKEAHACTEQYGRAYGSESLQDLCTVIKDNFGWCFNNEVITVDLLMKYREDFAANDIYVNVSVKSGYLLCDNATVRAWGNATVRAWGNATVRAWGNAKVEAWDNVKVRAWGNATVRAWGNAKVEAWDNVKVRAWDNVKVEARGNAYCTSFAVIECKLSENAIYRVRSTNTVFYASDDVKFVKRL